MSVCFGQVKSSRCLPLLLALMILHPGCGIRKETVKTSPAFLQAKTLQRQQLLDLFETSCRQWDSILIRQLSMTFLAENRSQGKREKLPATDGLLIITRQGDLRLQVQVPILKSAALEIVARKEAFKIWYPSKKTLYLGRMDDEALSVPDLEDPDGQAPRYNLSRLRPWHITQTFFHSRQPGTAVVTHEEDTATERFYVYEEISGAASTEPRLCQQLWLERSSLRIHRKRLFSEDGAVVSDISYHGYPKAGETAFPSEIRLRRPMEGYEVLFKLKKFELDAPVKDHMFEIRVPEDARIQELGNSPAR